MFKVCTTCNTEKPVTEFRKDKRRLDGLQSWCKTCARAHHKSAYTTKYGERVKAKTNSRMAVARDWVLEYKTSRGCLKCGETSGCCLDFHHTDPEQKDFELGGALSRSLAKIQQEVEKCVVLCKNCHTKVHAGELHL